MSSPLCGATQVWCDEFTPFNSGSPVYFKNPNVFTCEYKEGSYGWQWYQTGSDIECPTGEISNNQGHCIGGRSTINSQIENNLCSAGSDCINYANFDSGLCSSWAGICPIGMNNCTEYQDPSNPEGCDTLSVNGEDDHCDFYYYQSDKVDDTSCNSQINPDQGCRSFHQVDGGADVWYSASRCSEDPTVFCQTDQDCITVNLGTCTYVYTP